MKKYAIYEELLYAQKNVLNIYGKAKRKIILFKYNGITSRVLNEVTK